MANIVPVEQIYVIKGKLSELRTAPKTNDYCNICFDRKCSVHDRGTCSRDDATNTLNWWLNVGASESKDILILGNDDEILVPKFPKGNGEILENTKYNHVPMLKEMVFVYVDGEDMFFYTEDGTPMKPFPATMSTSGIYWGYLYENEFYSISTFSNGEWFNSRQRLSQAKNLPLEADIIGFLHIPKPRLTHGEFVKGVVRM